MACLADKRAICRLYSRWLIDGVFASLIDSRHCNVLQKLGISELFDVVTSVEFEERGKADPWIYCTVSRKLCIRPECCLVIEDSYSGMLAAKNASMMVIVFSNDNSETDLLLADYKIDDF